MNEVSMNKQMKLSQHFSLGELTKTKHVTPDGNIPSRVVIENLKRLCPWLEDLRYSYNTLYCLQPGEDYETSKNVEPIIINSGYRSPSGESARGWGKDVQSSFRVRGGYPLRGQRADDPLCVHLVGYR